MEKLTVKENIKGFITKDKANYKPGDEESLDALNPEENGKEYIGIKQNRKRMQSEAEIPDELPTAGYFPYPMDEHEYIGQFESKKNIYLNLAHALNKAVRRIKVLEDEIAKLKAKP